MEYYNRADKVYQAIVRNHILKPMVKVELLDQYENTYMELTQEISSQNQGSITSSRQQGVRKTISFSIFDPTGEFLPNPNDRLFWVNRRFKVYIGLATRTYEDEASPLLYSGNKMHQVTSTDDVGEKDTTVIKVKDTSSTYTEDIYWFPKGTFILTAISANEAEGSQLVSISGVDKFGAFTNDTGYNEMIGTFVLEAGTPIDKAIREILRQDIGNGELLDPLEPIIDPIYQGYTLPLDIDKGPGSYVGELLTDLANMLHADIYYDENGRMNVKPSMSADEYKNVRVQWDFHKGDQEYLSNTVTFDLLNVANSIYVVGDNPSAKILPVAWAENTNPSSPLCVRKIGRKTRYIESSTIQTQKEAADYARYILKTSTLLGHTINFESTLIPHLEIDNLITITDDYYGYNQEEFIMTSITYPLGVGTMSISGASIKELPEG